MVGKKQVGTLGRVETAKGNECCQICFDYIFAAGEEMIVHHKGNKCICNKCAADLVSTAIIKGFKRAGWKSSR